MQSNIISAVMIAFIVAALSCSKHDPAPDKKITPPDSLFKDSIYHIDGVFHEYHIVPHNTDNAIKKTKEEHYAYIDTRRLIKNKLLVFIGGTNSLPSDYQLFSQAAASHGYHVINLNYSNSVTTLICKGEADADCFTNYHEEIIFGNSLSSFVSVDKGNSIINRLLKLLQYLETTYPTDGWGQFYVGSDLNFDKFVLAGHSQGGGHAAYLAYTYAVDRLIVFSSPNDYSEKYEQPASWCSQNAATAINRFYGLLHKKDEVVPPREQYATWKDMKMLVAADTSSAEKSTYRNFHALYMDYLPNPDATSFKQKHNAPVMDEALPTGAQGGQIKQVWHYFLGT